MKHRIGLTLVFILAVISDHKVFSQSDQYKKNENNVEDKELIEYYKDGKVKAKWTYHGEEKNGPFQIFHITGQIWSNGTYEKDLPSGDIKFYDYNGNLIREEIWENGICRKQTKLKEWEPDGTIYTESENGVIIKYIWQAGKKIKEQ